MRAGWPRRRTPSPPPPATSSGWWTPVSASRTSSSGRPARTCPRPPRRARREPRPTRRAGQRAGFLVPVRRRALCRSSRSRQRSRRTCQGARCAVRARRGRGSAQLPPGRARRGAPRRSHRCPRARRAGSRVGREAGGAAARAARSAGPCRALGRRRGCRDRPLRPRRRNGRSRRMGGAWASLVACRPRGGARRARPARPRRVAPRPVGRGGVAPRPAVGARAGQTLPRLVAAAEGDVDEALELLAEAVRAHDSLGDRLGHARALLALGVVARRARQKRAAREAIEQALAIFEECGAAGFAVKARAELGRIGGRTREEGLTAAERRVAVLVAEGRTNREVAAALVLGERTVETHLTRIYSKLGIRSRTELARVYEHVS